MLVSGVLLINVHDTAIRRIPRIMLVLIFTLSHMARIAVRVCVARHAV